MCSWSAASTLGAELLVRRLIGYPEHQVEKGDAWQAVLNGLWPLCRKAVWPTRQTDHLLLTRAGDSSEGVWPRLKMENSARETTML